MKKLFISILAALCLLGLVEITHGQSTTDPLEKTKGFRIGIHGTANQINSSFLANAYGAGLGIELGAALKHFDIYLGIESVGPLSGDNTGSAYIDAGCQFNFSLKNPALIPYAVTGFSLQSSGAENEQGEIASIFAGGLFLGGGVKYFISSRLALVSGLKFSYAEGITYDTNSSSNTTDGNLFSTRLDVGLTWYPFN